MSGETSPHAAFRVLLLSGASSVHTIRWANAFAERGVDLHLVTQHDPVDALHPRITLHRLPHVAGLGYIANGPRLRRLVQRIRPDVVNAHYATGYGTLSRWVGSTPLVLNVWGSDVYDFPENGPLHRRLLRGNLRRADKVVSTSEAMAERTQAICPGLAPLAVVPFGVDTERFVPAPKPAAGGPVVIGTVKTFAPKYGVDTLIEAFAMLVKDDRPGPPLALRLVGGGPQEVELRTLVDHLGITDQVTFVPRVAHHLVPEELVKFDIYVALSRLDSESFGVAVIEASACGLPVLVSDVGGLPEVVVDGRTGRVVRRDDPLAAAEVLRELVHAPAERLEMGAAGRAHVQRVYEWEHCVQRMLDVLTRAARAGSRRSW